MGMRPLSLHVSALNDDEYATFTSSLEDLAAPDAASPGEIHYEKLSVTSREARAWLRGRYPDLPLNDLDAVSAYCSHTCLPLTSVWNSECYIDITTVRTTAGAGACTLRKPVLRHSPSSSTCPERCRARQKPCIYSR